MRSRSTRGVLVLVFVGAVVVVAGYVSASGGAAHPPLVSGYDIPETLDGRFELRGPPQTAPLITAEKALDLAMSYAAGLAPNPKDASVQYVAFTDTVRGVELTDGSIALDYADVPAWIVRLRGVPQPVFGGRHMPMELRRDQPQATELNVVLDARTGEYMEMFSFR